ncbi:flagellar filament capping protein FliD [Aliarcobacter cibarius]|uniref:Flagellar hook-associated protein 2 n=1 Tax=Aliarcobacter cibarius TaxID=255507 RepID=A0A7L5JRK1_9BACT|nr:flagellar filament capping protein FliD [Aliarcobacter cibarius]QKJ27847.1 flagellar filament cap protein [Aliarcobacter cibarius]TLT04897.1 flagellar hook protein FliD [Aliarcobacter cibarius]
MANGILGLGSGQASSLNNDLIDKLKTAEKKATLTPIETKLEKFTSEREVMTNIGTKVDELLAAVKVFSLNQTTGTHAFNSKSATTSGDAVMFDAEDLNALKTGFTTVNVTQLAQKDVWQTSGDPININLKDQKINQGILTINGKDFDTTNLSYDELVTEINKQVPGVIASLSDIGSTGFRLSIKSDNTGETNKIVVTGSTLLFDNVLKAQDMKMKVDGVDYQSSSNNMTVDGLKISATKIGESTINIEEDNSQLTKQMESFAKAYNELNATIDKELYSANSSISDKSALRDIMSKLKNTLFGTGNGETTIFSYGFSFNETNGDLKFNSQEFEKAAKTDKQSLQNLFVGVAEKPGIATILDETISISGIKKSLLDYDLNMLSRENTLKKDKETAEKTIDSRYEQMSLQFASYGAIINQMEASFSGLKMLIQQSTASNS